MRRVLVRLDTGGRADFDGRCAGNGSLAIPRDQRCCTSLYDNGAAAADQAKLMRHDVAISFAGKDLTIAGGPYEGLSEGTVTELREARARR